MAKLTPVETNGQVTGYYFDCPGCNGGHFLTVKPYAAENGASWEFNGNLDKPTFRPSVLSRVDFDSAVNKPSIVCHSFVTDGKIEFLNDCTHSKAGQTLELSDVE